MSALSIKYPREVSYAKNEVTFQWETPYVESKKPETDDVTRPEVGRIGVAKCDFAFLDLPVGPEVDRDVTATPYMLNVKEFNLRRLR